MIQRRLRFLRPSREMREFMILHAIERDPSASQRDLARASLMSSTMVNQYLAEMLSRDSVDIQGETNRTYQYRLTPLGHQRAKELLFLLSKEAVQFYGMIKEGFVRRLAELASEGARDVALFGAAETGEILLAACSLAGLNPVLAVDNDPSRHGRSLGHLTVQPPSALEGVKLDAILIASHGHADEIYAQVRPLEERGLRIWRL